ncbi:MAG: hypothetical protein HKN34_01405, partial [Gammaproteobacteria bacterium]|nr:hypothetical protein [Gammaproteobacteria bacterium]
MKRKAGPTKAMMVTMSLFFVSSCSSLYINPPGPEFQTILVLPLTAENTSGSPYGNFYQYEIVKEGEKKAAYKASFKLPNDNGFIIVDALSPGTYVVNKISSHPVATRSGCYTALDQARYDLIKLEHGKLSIFRNSIDVTQKPYGRGSCVSNYRISSVDSGHRSSILDKLRMLGNFDMWGVSDTLSSDQILSAPLPDTIDIVARFPKMSVGDSWITRQAFRGGGEAKWTYEVISVNADGTFDMKLKNDKDQFEYFEHFDSKAPWVPMLLGVRYDPRALQFPLFVGKEWETEVAIESIAGNYNTYRNRYIV